ncbi:hypothetical protein ACFWWM_33805 [Streptomyces sp. NPDC058682]|uniref:hypothetical protein n=1 Tax=Streptomyces sp. NPDC058682 TaxID=3346596 RepID=UPI0036646374
MKTARVADQSAGEPGSGGALTQTTGMRLSSMPWSFSLRPWCASPMWWSRVRPAAAAVAQLLHLRGAGELTTAHVRLVAESLDVSVRQVWRWLARAEETGSTEKPERNRFRITEKIIDVLADHQGNVKHAHEHLVREARAEGRKPIGLTTLHDAIARDLDPGFMAGLREGIPAARGFDPAFRRPAVARNQVWEGDHKQAPLVVMMPDKTMSRVWVTWFEDRGTGYVMGWAVTAGSAHRGSVLAAVRASVLREDPYGPAGGLPHLVRVDGGADFLSKTVRRAFGLLVPDRLQEQPAPDVDAPDEDPVRAAWTEERLDLVQSLIALCDKGLADVAVPADGEHGDRFMITDAGRSFLAQQ